MKNILKNIFYGILAAYIPCVIIASFYKATSDFTSAGIFVLILCISLGIFTAFSEFGFTVLRMLEEKKLSRAEKTINIIRICLAVLALIAYPIGFINGQYSLLFAGLLILLWIISAVIAKSEESRIGFLFSKAFWISALSVVLLTTALFAIPEHREHENRKLAYSDIEQLRDECQRLHFKLQTVTVAENNGGYSMTVSGEYTQRYGSFSATYDVTAEEYEILLPDISDGILYDRTDRPELSDEAIDIVHRKLKATD